MAQLRYFKSDISSCGNQVMYLKFDLQPTAKRFKKQSRLRVSIVCADKGNLACVEFPDAALDLLTARLYLSALHLPLVLLEVRKESI